MCYAQIPKSHRRPKPEPKLRKSDTHNPHRAAHVVGWGLSVWPGSRDSIYSKPQPTRFAASSFTEAKLAATMPYKH
jgi:hypothetical protein